jgi:site-specific recombinase XerD
MDSFPLPLDAQRFLQAPQGVGAEQVVRHFYHWMKAKDLSPTTLSLEDVKSFYLEPIKRTGKPRTRSLDKRKLVRYLNRLKDEGRLGFDPKQLLLRPNPRFPVLAALYVRSLEPTHKPKTQMRYRSILGRFHRHLEQNQIDLKKLDRASIERWLLELSDQGLAPETRVQMLTVTRSYLHWLLDRDELIADPDDLIRPSDRPKLPTFLPRPLSPAQDATLQQRLESSSDRFHQALLLMRLTGLRVGELASLPPDCIRTDLDDKHLLKVPLGKLDNERLVPIDGRVVAIVESLRQQLEQPDAHQYLIANVYGERIPTERYRKALAQVCEGIETAKPITCHRLRHSYATSLLSAGVSLPSLMRLLGHRDIKMTLRYAAITQELVKTEYFQALPKIELRYRDAIRTTRPSTEFDPVKSLVDTSQWIRKHIASEPASQRIARSLIKRLARIQVDLDRQIAILHLSRPR